MRTKDAIHQEFRKKVRDAASDLADVTVNSPEQTDNWAENFEYTVNVALKQRDKALKELYVRVGREHLQVLTDWFVKALQGYDRTDSSTQDILRRNPRCFGSRTSSKTCGKSELRIEGLCAACIAISPLLGDDC